MARAQRNTSHSVAHENERHFGEFYFIALDAAAYVTCYVLYILYVPTLNKSLTMKSICGFNRKEQIKRDREHDDSCI